MKVIKPFDRLFYKAYLFIRHGLLKSLEFKNQVSDSIRLHFAQHLHEELQGFTSQKLFDDFIQDLDGLSLHFERLEARIQPLMSCHEID
ncbi:hypothetical protein [Legionella pneumophila]|uniref:Protein YigP n=1 Tax=Legionella pneumophila subsp. pascullei TaxID=91890 RepID=A0AAX2J0J2_LEGPN|nr:hypothetical protein [Legionella pneumophila]AMP90841.1 hypothetical protein AXF35_14520 [Legionella pneumophila subsp. pascullei]AMP93825.1 hypothetical protein AXF36_14885 [Legionella pneumophila subsp. pascullei]AMP96742.1 hypothetical protein AXF37_14520 [Legionella pneumophila subsp. pascullei]SQG91791.1 Protein YigP [Legionella pneumophila subsp. pascullei]VEH08337.1 Protein YigP [Legionella pneumophila subsp. pascullei]